MTRANISVHSRWVPGKPIGAHVPRLMAYLLYGAGPRVPECCRLRVQDTDFATNQLVVRGGKGDKDRVAMLPAIAKADLGRHLEAVRTQHQEDPAADAWWVELPTALLRKYPNAGREWAWHGVFPPPAPSPARDRPAARRESSGARRTGCSPRDAPPRCLPAQTPRDRQRRPAA